MSESVGILQSLSQELASATAKAASSIVRVDDSSRLTASGVVWEAGVIVATSHGVERDEDLYVETGDGTRQPATLVGRDQDTDLAVLKAATGAPPIDRAPDSDIAVGSLVLAIGRPGDSGLHATLGIVSAKKPTSAGKGNGNLIHTDAVLYPGFSGGAIVDATGRLVGIANRWHGRGQGGGIGLGIVEETVDAILRNGRVSRGYLGVRTQPVQLSDGLRKRLGIDQEAGLLLIHVEEGSAAEEAGLMIGDVAISIDSQTISDPNALRRTLRGREAGAEVALEVIRGGDRQSFRVRLGVRE